jgi:hypothetical protein
VVRSLNHHASFTVVSPQWTKKREGFRIHTEPGKLRLPDLIELECQKLPVEGSRRHLSWTVCTNDLELRRKKRFLLREVALRPFEASISTIRA